MKTIIKRRERIKKQLMENLDFIQGTLVKLYRRCGKEGCRCQKGELHGPAYYISTKENRITKMEYIPVGCVSSVKKAMAKNYRIKKILKEISRINIQIVKEAYVREKR